jgi:hypothetical protein
MQLQPRTRPLLAAEKRLLAARARALRTRQAGPRRVVLLTAAIVGILWVATLLAADAPPWVVTLFWLVFGSGFGFWLWREERGNVAHMRSQAQQLESAIQRDEAEVFDIAARGFVEFEEVEDEGACYAFDLGNGTLAFVVGQQFYPAARFPSLDFSLVYPLDGSGNSADELVDKRGPTATPVRVIPGSVKLRLEIPEHLAVVHGSVEQIEDALAAQS